MHFYLVAGELSGDNHGAALMRALQSQLGSVIFSGAGGPEMQALARPPFLEWTGHAVVGLWEVIKNYPYFRRQFQRVIKEITQMKPDAVILIDYPGFNLRLAAALRKKLPNLKIIYYISPQVWAWNRGRIPQMARWLDLMICIFPFEKELYEKSGLRTEFAGHPIIDELEKKRLPDASRDPLLVGLFPGSREREVKKLLPVMLATAKVLRERNPLLQFAIPAASEKLLALVERIAAGFPGCTISLRGAYPLMQTCSAAMIASGTATLEAAFFGLPYVLLYKVSPLTYEVGRRLIRIPYLGIANVLADREIIPEFVQNKLDPTQIADTLTLLIDQSEKRAEMQKALQEVIAKLGDKGAASRAAQAICRLVV